MLEGRGWNNPETGIPSAEVGASAIQNWSMDVGNSEEGVVKKGGGVGKKDGRGKVL